MRMDICSLIVCVLSFSAAQSQTMLDELRAQWRSGSYQAVLTKLFDYREQPYGRTAEVDYMIATSACRLPEVKKMGSQYFGWILSHYSLEKRTRNIILEEMRACAPDVRPAAVNFSSLWSTWGSAGVKGKVYYWLNTEDAALANNPVEVIREIPYEELNHRLFLPEQSGDAVAAVRARVGKQFKVLSSGPFVIATSSGQNEGDLKSMASTLGLYMSFFQRKYNIPHPSHLITIYLVPDAFSLWRLAETIHGIRVNESSIGYSFRDDLSIVGVIPRTICGTLAHELFHLMVRNNFGDIPPWLDEGIAALYEVSNARGDSVYGIPNWRGAVLQKFWNLRPPVDSLVSMDWQAFENAEGDFEARQQATNHATARYFVLYLQEKGRLFDVYAAFRDQSAQQTERSPAMEARTLLQSLLEKPLPVVDKEFAEWFRHLHH